MGIGLLNKSDEEFIKNLTFSWEEKGIEKGIVKGIEKGKEKEKRKIALEMLDKGLSIELIAKVTHLKLGEIEDMKKE